MLRTSELWITIFTVIGSILTGLGVVPTDAWDNILWPAIVYIISRVISKIAKRIMS